MHPVWNFAYKHIIFWFVLYFVGAAKLATTTENVQYLELDACNGWHSHNQADAMMFPGYLGLYLPVRGLEGIILSGTECPSGISRGATAGVPLGLGCLFGQQVWRGVYLLYTQPWTGQALNCDISHWISSFYWYWQNQTCGYQARAFDQCFFNPRYFTSPGTDTW